MSSTDRQNRLLVAEDWKRIYQSFRNADFQSYDFENLRRVMINYLRENYPEDFNDYIESSEHLALVDLIAWMGQSISFRTDLNARENFLELAERRDSVLRLARLLSYNPKRNMAASGLLRFTSISTTQNVIDSNGRNISGQNIVWNDSTNQNWYDQFIKVINAALPSSRQFGNPDDKSTIYGIPTEQYRFQSTNADVPVYSFSKNIDGRNMPFEIVSTTFADASEIYEEAPIIGNRLAFVYRDDGKGTSSNNTGFFIHFKQGVLNQGTFNILQPSTNESVDLDTVNINNDDVWLYKLDQNGTEVEKWVQVPAIEGNNIIYNSLNKNIKNIFSVITKAGDRISLIFSDGTFGNIPLGSFRVYYRASNGLSYTINPKDIRNVSVSIPYASNTGQLETLTLNLSLVSSVSNSAESETNDSIKANAPSTYYTQNRMITGEDYNVAPLGVNQDVLKIKAVNRTSSGISRYFDLIDPTGKYSKTNIFSDDGAIYKDEYNDSLRFSYVTKTEVEAVVYNQILDILKSKELRDFYYSKYKQAPTGSELSDPYTWNLVTLDTNQITGQIFDSSSVPQGVASNAPSPDSILHFVTVGSLLKFTKDGQAYWSSVTRISGSGTVISTVDDTGPIYLTDFVPDGAELEIVIPRFKTSLDVTTISTMVDLIFGNQPFGLRYDINATSWKIVFDVNLNTTSGFDTADAGNTNGQKKDASWLLLFTTDTEYYTVKQRLLRYIFESDKQVRFFFDGSDKIYDTRTNTIVKDQIKILGINEQLVPSNTPPDRNWEISSEYIGLDGYVDTKKIQLTFSDSDDDGIVDNPDLFEEFVPVTAPNSSTGYIVVKVYVTEDGLSDYALDESADIVFVETESSISLTGPLNSYYYIQDIKTVKKLVTGSPANILIPSNDYKVYEGKSGIKFQYIHNADYDTRIDPGLTNIMDIFVLTKQYDTLYRQWISGAITEQPLPPSTDQLYTMMASDLNKIKSTSDEIVYHPVKFKVLFGQKATRDVRATFKVVKNSELVVSDNDVKSRVLSAINAFFSLENWDFGDKFYFSELNTYVMNRLSPYIVNFVIVPTLSDLTFGSLYEISAEKDQIFINGATIDDIEIITSITASQIKSEGAIALETGNIQALTITSQ